MRFLFIKNHVSEGTNVNLKFLRKFTMVSKIHLQITLAILFVKLFCDLSPFRIINEFPKFSVYFFSISYVI